MKIYFGQIFGVISWGFFFIGVNGASSVRRSSGIWVIRSNCVESVTFLRRCSNISLWSHWLKLC